MRSTARYEVHLKNYADDGKHEMSWKIDAERFTQQLKGSTNHARLGRPRLQLESVHMFVRSIYHRE